MRGLVFMTYAYPTFITLIIIDNILEGNIAPRTLQGYTPGNELVFTNSLTSEVVRYLGVGKKPSDRAQAVLEQILALGELVPFTLTINSDGSCHLTREDMNEFTRELLFIDLALHHGEDIPLNYKSKLLYYPLVPLQAVTSRVWKLLEHTIRFGGYGSCNDVSVGYEQQDNLMKIYVKVEDFHCFYGTVDLVTGLNADK